MAFPSSLIRFLAKTSYEDQERFIRLGLACPLFCSEFAKSVVISPIRVIRGMVFWLWLRYAVLLCQQAASSSWLSFRVVAIYHAATSYGYISRFIAKSISLLADEVKPC
jgi:hypothetical protein